MQCFLHISSAAYFAFVTLLVAQLQPIFCMHIIMIAQNGLHMQNDHKVASVSSRHAKKGCLVTRAITCRSLKYYQHGD